MMTGAAPREGFYLVTADWGPSTVQRISTGWWVKSGGESLQTDLPPDWTLGPRLDDLLRDATRLDWAEREGQRFFSALARAAASSGVRAVIDAEIARERRDD